MLKFSIFVEFAKIAILSHGNQVSKLHMPYVKCFKLDKMADLPNSATLKMFAIFNLPLILNCSNLL